MRTPDFDHLVRKKFAEFERQNGRVPTMQELASTLGVEERMLERKLRKALATMGTDLQTEGTSAFKSTLRQILSKGLLQNETPVESDLQLLLMKARQSKSRAAELTFIRDDIYGERKVVITVALQAPGRDPLWTVWQGTVKVLEYETDLQTFDNVLETWRRTPDQHNKYPNRVPSKEVLEILVGTAEKTKTNMAFHTFSSNRKQYRLLVESAPPHDEYSWSLYEEDFRTPSTETQLFTYKTSDFQLVENLLTTACAEEKPTYKNNVVAFKRTQE